VRKKATSLPLDVSLSLYLTQAFSASQFQTTELRQLRVFSGMSTR